MEFHYVVGYDSLNKKWFVEAEPGAYFPDGHVFDPKTADQTGYGWFMPEGDSPEDILDNELFRTLYYIVDTFPIPEESND